MGILFRYDNIEEGLSIPIVLSFRLVLEIPETLYNTLNEKIDLEEPPTSCLISQLRTRKNDDTYQLLISVNLLSLYEKWSDDENYTYRDILYFLKSKLCERYGDEVFEPLLTDEKLDCDFIEYSFIARGRDEIVGMQECYAPSNQITKTRWDDYLETKKEKANQKNFYKDEELIDYIPCCIEYCHSDYAHKVDTNSEESYNSCHNDFYECYVRCNGLQLQRFCEAIEQIDFVGRQGLLLKYVYDGNLKRALCQCAFELGCRRRCATVDQAKLIYEEFNKEFQDSSETESL